MHRKLTWTSESRTWQILIRWTCAACIEAVTSRSAFGASHQHAQHTATVAELEHLYITHLVADFCHRVAETLQMRMVKNELDLRKLQWT